MRACYAALRMQETVAQYAEEVQRSHGVPVAIRVGLNSGEIVVRAIGNDLHMDYTVVGQTAHLAARMEQMATPGSVLTTADTVQLAEGYIAVKPLGPVPVKGLADPVQIYEVTGAGAARTRLQAAAGRGLTRFVGRDVELEQLRRAQQLASKVTVRWWRSSARRGWASRASCTSSFIRAIRRIGWFWNPTPLPTVAQRLTCRSSNCSGDYFKINVHDSTQSIREKVTARILTLDPSLQDAIPPVLDLLDALDDEHPFRSLDPLQHRQCTYQAVIRLLLSESRVQPVVAVFEDLHWNDSLTPRSAERAGRRRPECSPAPVVSYRPDYRDEWRHRPNYHQLRLDPLASESLAEFLQALLGSDPSLPALKSFLVERASGNPFFVEEIVRVAGRYRRARGRARQLPPGRGRSRAIEVPPTVQAVLAARIDALPAAEKRLLQEAAVIGHDVPFDLLHAICGLTEDELRGLLDNLQAAEFLYATQLFPDLQYTFKHSLTHDVTYSGVLHERRRDIHARVVDAIESFTPTGWASRSSGSPITPCGASCVKRRCTISGRPEGRRPRDRRCRTRGPGSSRRWVFSRHCRRARPRWSRPSRFASSCGRCCASSVKAGRCSSISARPRPSPSG